MAETFSQKEMLIRMMSKLDIIEDKLSKTHEQVYATNGKVKLHTKFITALAGGLITAIGWLVSIALR